MLCLGLVKDYRAHTSQIHGTSILLYPGTPHHEHTLITDDQSVSTIGGGRDTTIPSPGRSPKQPLSGIGLHVPPHGRQACSEFNSFH